jgi:hypothetical protein
VSCFCRESNHDFKWPFHDACRVVCPVSGSHLCVNIRFQCLHVQWNVSYLTAPTTLVPIVADSMQMHITPIGRSEARVRAFAHPPAKPEELQALISYACARALMILSVVSPLGEFLVTGVMTKYQIS